MSAFADRTPVLAVALENPFHKLRYPEKGGTTAVVDTGYEGFVAVPPRVFEELSLGELATSRRVRTADGRMIESRLALSTVLLPDLDITLDGHVETMAGLSEILVGTAFLSRFSVSLDYCLRTARMQQCR